MTDNNNKQKKSRRRTIIKDSNLAHGVAGTTAVLPTLKLPQNDPSHTVYTKPAGERQVVNVVSILLNEQLGTALERFNACACQKCCLEITCRVLKEIPPAFVHVSTINDADEVNGRLSEMRADVIKVITKTVMAGLTKPYHTL